MTGRCPSRCPCDAISMLTYTLSCSFMLIRAQFMLMYRSVPLPPPLIIIDIIHHPSSSSPINIKVIISTTIIIIANQFHRHQPSAAHSPSNSHLRPYLIMASRGPRGVAESICQHLCRLVFSHKIPLHLLLLFSFSSPLPLFLLLLFSFSSLFPLLLLLFFLSFSY